MKLLAVFITTLLKRQSHAGQRRLVLVVREIAPGDTVLEGLENEAREARIGLWADPQPVPPWEWRAQRRAGFAQ